MKEENTKIDLVFLEILSNHTAGSPMDEEIIWTNLTLNKIVDLMEAQNLKVSRYEVKQLLKKHKYRRRTLQKTKTMKEVKYRNEQFLKIADLIEEYQAKNLPVISIDTKKKEQIGDFHRAGTFYGTEERRVYDHDFASFAEGAVIPHGIYDLKRNEGYMTLGTTKDTSEFCCDNMRRWWLDVGQYQYPSAKEILVLADGGGSNSSRHYIFKQDLYELANELGISIRIAHYPPYTSKYNPIEHKLFCHITRACQGAVFSSIEIVKNLMSQATTKTGLKVLVQINDKVYKTKRKALDSFKENMPIVFDGFLGQWNYVAPALQ